MSVGASASAEIGLIEQVIPRRLKKASCRMYSTIALWLMLMHIKLNCWWLLSALHHDHT